MNHISIKMFDIKDPPLGRMTYWFGKGGAASCLYLLCFICLPLCAQGLCTIKVCLVKAMVFPVVMYGCESWTIKKAEHRRTGAFELWC